MKSWALAASAVVLMGLAGAAQGADWAGALRQDAQAFHDDIAANHPGMFDAANPTFAGENDRQLALAMQRAERTTDFAGYGFAMRGYSAAFDDGHLEFAAVRDRPMPALVSQWPGFLTAFDSDGLQRVTAVSEASPLPVGAELVACDGRPADALAAANVGAFNGRWFLPAVRMQDGGRLFLDEGNPWSARPDACVFQVGAEQRRVTLNWRPIAADERDRQLAATFNRAAEPIGMRTLADGTLWLTLSDFKADPAGPAAKALVPLIAALNASPDKVRGARAIVLDVRGNHGGSSDWSRQIARAVWGREAVDAVRLGSTAVEWRASPANIATLAEFAAALEASSDSSPELRAWLRETLDGMEAAQAAGRPMWASPPSSEEASASVSPAATQTPLVLAVTDAGCGSACLDAMDLWLALGAIHVGQETTADTLYMDARKDVLPSGFGRAIVPMKVFRGRQRGGNVPLTPTHVYQGSLADTPRVEAWVQGVIRDVAAR